VNTICKASEAEEAPVEMKPAEKVAEAVVDMKPVETDVTVTQAGVEGKRQGEKKGKGGSDAPTQETTEAVVEMLPTEKENPDMKAVFKGKGKGKGKGKKDVKLCASLKEILNVNIPANDSDDDSPLVPTKRASSAIASSDDDEIINKEKALRSNDVTTNVQVNKKNKIHGTTTAPSTISDRGVCLILPWIEKQKKKLGISLSTPQGCRTIEEALKTDVKKLCPTVTFPTNQIKIKEILDCIPENLYDAVVKGLCGLAEELLITPSTKEKAIQETPKRAAGIFSKPATTVDTLNKQRIYQESVKQTTMVASPTSKTMRVNRNSPAVIKYMRI